MHKIMLVDDEPNVMHALRRSLGLRVQDREKTFDIEVETYEQPEAALWRARDTKFDLVISDFRMPCMDGVSFLKAFRELQPDAVRIILSGYTDLDGLIGAINEANIYRFISKPWRAYDLSATVAQALALHGLMVENQRLADVVRVQQGKLTRQEMELRRLEEETPGITKVMWGPDGSVMLEED